MATFNSDSYLRKHRPLGHAPRLKIPYWPISTFTIAALCVNISGRITRGEPAQNDGWCLEELE
jgi:hypothetical protein